MQSLPKSQLANSSAAKALSAKETEDARKLVNVLLLAWKNYGLYPEGHAATGKALENLMHAFDNYFSSHGGLRVSIEKDRLLCRSVLLHEVSADSRADDIIFLLYRDGIQWLEFREGLSIEELGSFFSILIKFRILVDETEGDIVTALTDANLDHIEFKAVDIFWQGLPPIDFSQLDTSLPTPEDVVHETATTEPAKPEEQGPGAALIKSIADPSVSDALWQISATEKEKLQQMVSEEENWANTEDVFDVLLVILNYQTEQENFAAVLDFTLEEVVATIEQEEFGLLLKLFQSLHQLLYRDTSSHFPWTRPLVDRFFHDISKPEIIDRIISKILLLQDSDTEKIMALRHLLLYFPPEIILSLGQVLMQSRSSRVQQMTMEVIEYLCHRDIGPLEKILADPDQEIGEKLLAILKRLQGEGANGLFLKMSEHPSEKLRREAVRILLSRAPQYAQKLFALIDDPSEDIRAIILAGIAQQRSAVLENLLLKYLKENYNSKDPSHLLACYKALGCCATGSAVPFLRRILLDKGWNSLTGFGKLQHREGAATALALLDTWEAKDILLAASKSKFKVIKEAFNRAMKKSATFGDTLHD